MLHETRINDEDIKKVFLKKKGIHVLDIIYTHFYSCPDEYYVLTEVGTYLYQCIIREKYINNKNNGIYHKITKKSLVY